MQKMKVFTYIITKDFGFAPNPFHGFCTLATCKATIRKGAKIGDWVLGLGSKALENRGYLIYAMKISDKLTFNEYWKEPKFQCKKPIEGGSQKIIYGDNIYHQSKGKWYQANSNHSKKNGKPHIKNIKYDTKSEVVLVSEDFYYFGNKKICLKEINKTFAYEVKKVRHKDYTGQSAEKLIKLIKIFLNKKKYKKGIHGDPINWEMPCPREYLQ